MKLLVRIFTWCHMCCCIACMYPYLDTVDELHLRMFHYHNADSRSQSCYTDIQDTPQFLDTCSCCYYIDMADTFVPRYSQDIHIRQLSRHILGLVHYNHKLKKRRTEEITTSRWHCIH